MKAKDIAIIVGLQKYVRAERVLFLQFLHERPVSPKVSGIGRKTAKPQYFMVYQILSNVEYRFQPVLIFGKNWVRILASVMPYSKGIKTKRLDLHF